MFQRLRPAALIAAAMCTALLFGPTGTAQADGSPLIARVGSGDHLVAIGYEHSDYGGAALQFFSDHSDCSPTSRTHNFDTFPPGWNDRISSMRIGGGTCGAYAFDHINRHGPMVTIGGYVSSMPAGWNDRLSSLEVTYAWWWPRAR
ncbi:hypothetical protein [Streptomyces clavuligerus]|uniref:Secreted protein n=1 Tax=Streptomyces clavuligerus TaxID=1901 RepID=B5GTL9_STRCL|nr:hypothetical protein [Streptomyces clavuligerus]EDY49665.1 hypothetical protein SSCG_02767 [Streptomyces clavuligerus]EFG04086.1 Hypothetical protein SCLAV_p0599 [Streptomyces clavuligerus]MBY6307427.1 hypothetical protein [Streptomyces clavuligerus]QCS10014.1 hypothetical protein CRV15_31010 [Streptomyces clavuligerus]QPJ97942.1 hypothetical protein GE265_33435 [Streptomyces clavuligerus]